MPVPDDSFTAFIYVLEHFERSGTVHKRSSHIVALYRRYSPGNRILHGVCKHATPLLHGEVRNDILCYITCISGENAVRISVLPYEKAAVRILRGTAVYSQHFDEFRIGGHYMSAYPLKADWKIGADFIKVVPVRHPVSVSKEILIPARRMKSVLHPFRMLCCKLSAYFHHLVYGFYSVNLSLIHGLPGLHEVKVAVI